VRALTVAEIKEQAFAQIAEAGPDAMSLSGIAKAMGMSGPAMYRYFASREELMATLVTESFEDLADFLSAVAAGVRKQSPEDRLRAVAHGFRDWGLASPHRYRLVFGSTYGTGALDPARIIPAATRSMTAILSALDEFGASTPSGVSDEVLGGELQQWGKRQGVREDFEVSALLLGIVAWTRLHGIVSLEIEGFFLPLEVDPARVFDSEIDHLISQRGSGDGRSAVTADET
jgi:AcrR family transcriptional regulator